VKLSTKPVSWAYKNSEVKYKNSEVEYEDQFPRRTKQLWGVQTVSTAYKKAGPVFGGSEG